jgi:hypothetical protein
MSKTEDGIKFLTPTEMDRADNGAVAKRAHKAAKNHPKLRESKSDKAKSSKVYLGRGTYRLGMTAAGVAQIAQKSIVGRAEWEEYYKEHPPVQHVRDGKPLTAHGAKLLGVPWKGQPE